MENYKKMGYFTFEINSQIREEAVYYSIAKDLFTGMTVKDFLDFFNL